MDKDINEMTRKDFDKVPSRKWNENIGEFDSLITLPSRTLHESGYRCMDFVAVRDNKAIARLSGCSDVIHLDGIGGYGLNWMDKYHRVPDATPPTGWSIDCLPKSGLLRLFPNSHKLHAGSALSSFELFAVPRKEPSDASKAGTGTLTKKKG